MPLSRARRTDLSRNTGRPDGVIYRQQYVRCGKPNCHSCPPAGPGHGPYWYGFYWDYRQRTPSFYVGKHLPAGVEELADDPAPGDTPAAAGDRPPPEQADTTQ
jgi:hypothetical protein